MAVSKARKAAFKRDAKEFTYDDTSSIYPLKKLGKAKDRIRLLPILGDGANKIMKRVGTHFLDGKPYECTRITRDKRCPICDKRFELSKKNDDESRALADKMKTSIRYAMKVISRNDQAANNGIPSRVLIIEAPKAIADEIWKTMTGQDPEDDDGDFDWDEAIEIDDELQGHDVIISRKGTGQYNTKYFAKIAKEPSKLHKSAKVRKRLIKDASKIDLSTWGRRKTDTDLETLVDKMFGGKKKRRHDDDDDDDYDYDEDDGGGKKKKKKNKKGKKGKKNKKSGGTMKDLKRKMKEAKNRK